MKTKHVCGKIGGPGNLFGRSTDDANLEGNGFEFIPLHVVTKNLQSVKSNDRFYDFIAELDQCSFDICLFSETWRVETEEVFVTPAGHKLFFSGGGGGGGEGGHQGVGGAIHKRLLQQINSISFSAFASRVCQLQFSLRTTYFRCIAVYFPTTWHSEDDVEQVYTLLGFLLDASVKDGCVPVLGGDFNACIGPLTNHEALDQIGQWGSRRQNERGRFLMRFVMGKGLQICSRHNASENMEASWTCCRTLDKTCVQLDYILANFRLQIVEVWNDFALPIGLDHRCAHCILQFQRSNPPRVRRQRGLKRWQPTLDSDGLPARFFFFLFSPLLFEPQKSQILGLFYWAVSRHWTKRVGHFYPGGSGIAGELAKSKPELLKEGLGGGWARGVGLGPRPGVGSREDHYLQHW